MSIKRFKQFGNKTGYATKAELDSMSKDEITDYCIDFVTKHRDSPYGKEEKRYMKELSTYEDIRFVDERIAQYREWGVQAKEDPKSDARVVGGAVNRLGAEYMYAMFMKSQLEELGEFKYIIGIVLPDFSDIE